MQRHHIGERHGPQVVKLDQHWFEHLGEIEQLGRGEICQACMRLFWGDEYFISIPREIRNERNGRLVLRNNASAVIPFRFQNILKQYAAGLSQIALANLRFLFYRAENEIGCVDLTMRMRIRNTYGYAFVLKDQHVSDLRQRRQLAILRLPHLQQLHNIVKLEFSKRQIVLWAVTNYARDSVCRPILVNG